MKKIFLLLIPLALLYCCNTIKEEENNSIEKISGFVELPLDSIVYPQKNNPVSKYAINWTDEYNWNEVVNINDFKGVTINEKLDNAQNLITEKGGGVIFFPPGVYYFYDDIKLKTGIIIRGVSPVNTLKFNNVVPEDIPEAITDAREPGYTLATKFVFPKYQPKFNGNGHEADDAFKAIRLFDKSGTNQCGIVHIFIENGNIILGDLNAMQQDYETDKRLGNFLVYGCILINSVSLSNNVPADFQEEWQRWNDPLTGAITIYASKNVLVANNRIEESTKSNLVMQDYLVYNNKQSYDNRNNNISRQCIIFDYNNRSGVRVNAHPAMKGLSIWNDYQKLDTAIENNTYEKFIAPGTLAEGIQISNNYIFSSGKAAIKSGGRGTFIGYNIIRFKPNLIRHTANGLYMDAFTNDNRAIEVRGWEWIIEGNDYEVYSNFTPAGIKFNDGEGIMHEAWENIDIRESKILYNKGNRYISIWRVPVHGLLIKGNHIRIYRDFHSIFVNAQSRPNKNTLIDLPCENVMIENNITEKSGITILGEKSEGNFIRYNQHKIAGEGKLINAAGANIYKNVGYQED